MRRLTDDDLRQFAEDGYLVVKDVVPESLLSAADVEVDALIREIAPEEGHGGPGQSSWTRPPSRLPKCDDVLRRSPALAVAMELVAPNTLDLIEKHIQVATTVSPWSHLPEVAHIDGYRSGQHPPDSFTMLAGVLLTDQQLPGSGNLWVWPGSHLVHQRLFHERGTDALGPTGGSSTMLDPPVTLRRQTPVTGQRGDLVLAHFLLGHSPGGNTSSRMRRTIYYRLQTPGHQHVREQALMDAWTEYPPVRHALDDAAN
jgi:ectoine hydroxylase-related dioxygenase (phytanoyl-CoA dioxygenase family)